MKTPCIYVFLILLIGACKNPNSTTDVALKSPNQRPYSIEWVVEGLQNPWGMTWLPDGSMLITEKSGTLLQFKSGKKTEIAHTLNIHNYGQGGFLDVQLHPKYQENGWIYFTHSSSDGQGPGGNTQLSRAKLKNDQLVSVEKLYKAEPNSRRAQHFGSRIAFDNDGFVYFSIGDRGDRDTNPQDITRDCGKIYRLHDDGRIPKDNPFVNQENAKTAIYSYGHRNPQGLAKHPETGAIWEHEHGPKGGDEINIIEKGKNYGWPVVTYGVNYSGTQITDETSRPSMEDPIHYWVPSIAPCGMDFVTGNNYPDWAGHLLVGSLKFGYVELVRLNGTQVIGREKIAEDIGRVRNVKMGPDGLIYIALEGQGIARLRPEN